MSFDINKLIDALQVGEEVEKQASEAEVVAAPTVADDLRAVLMTKSASTIREEADSLGRQLARRILEKSASETPAVSEVVAGDNLSALAASVETALMKEASEVSPQANIANTDNNSLASAQEQVNQAAVQSGGTVEAQTVETIQKGLSTPSATATSEDLVRKVEDKAEDANMQKAAAVNALVEQGHNFYDAADLVAMADGELQKEAAFAELTAEGYSFDEATSLIKAASESFATSGEEEITKEAAMSDLLDQGIPFDEAVNMIKEAGAVSVVKTVASKAPGFSRKQIGAAVAGGAAVAAGAVGAKKSMTKEAALKELMDSGYTFTQALDAIQA